jgi:hypothetical protein
MKKQFVMIFVAIVMSMFIIQGTLVAGELSPATGPEVVVPEAQTEFDEILADIEADRWAVVDDLVKSLAKDDDTAEQLRATLDGLSAVMLAEIVQNSATLDDVTTILTGKTPGELAEEIIPLGEIDRDFAYTAVKPCRIIDTRIAGGAFSPGASREFNVYGSVASQGGAADCPSPRGEPRAVHINVTAVPVSGQGNFRAYPANMGPPNASLVNYKAGVQNVANAGTIQTYWSIGPEEIEFLNSNGTAHLIVDVLGYYHDAYPAGADFAASSNNEVTLIATGVTVKSVNINAPAAGKVIVNASGYFRFNSTSNNGARCSIISGSSSVVDYTHLIIAGDTGGVDNSYVPFSTTRGFNVNSGTTTFRLNCNEWAGDVSVGDPTINAIWVPNTY